MFTNLSTTASRRVTRDGHETFGHNLLGTVRDESSVHGASDVEHTTERPLSHDHSRHKSTLLVTDAASDLPATWRAKAGVLLLPIKLRNGEVSRIDDGDEVAAAHFAAKNVAQFDGPTHTLAASAETTGELINRHSNDSTDFVLQIAMSSMRSNSYANSLTAAQKLMVQGARDRRRAGNTRPFKMWVVDSGASFNGHGVLIAECARLRSENVAVPQIVQQVDALRRQVKTLVVPRDLRRFHHCAALPEAPVSHWLSRNVGQLFDRMPVAVADGDDLRILSTQSGFAAAAKAAFDQATRSVKTGLDAPFVCISYAGDTADLRHINAFVQLSATCAKHGVMLLTSTMSMTNAALLGAGGVLISLASSLDFQ